MFGSLWVGGDAGSPKEEGAFGYCWWGAEQPLTGRCTRLWWVRVSSSERGRYLVVGVGDSQGLMGAPRNRCSEREETFTLTLSSVVVWGAEVPCTHQKRLVEAAGSQLQADYHLFSG